MHKWNAGSHWAKIIMKNKKSARQDRTQTYTINRLLSMGWFLKMQEENDSNTTSYVIYYTEWVSGVLWFLGKFLKSNVCLINETGAHASHEKWRKWLQPDSMVVGGQRHIISQQTNSKQEEQKRSGLLPGLCWTSSWGLMLTVPR